MKLKIQQFHCQRRGALKFRLLSELRSSDGHYKFPTEDIMGSYCQIFSTAFFFDLTFVDKV